MDEWIAIDWSGAKNKETPSISVAKEGRLVAPKKRKHWSREAVADWLIEESDGKKRLLVGIDSNFGLAGSIVCQMVPTICHVRELWQLVDTLSQETDNFYAEPFWQSFPNYFWTDGKQKGALCRRETEYACNVAGFGFPESPFKLIGPKQVGKGGLAAMRMAYYLSCHLQEKVAFWPFDSLEQIQKAKLVLFEIYPRLFIKMAGLGSTKIRDHETLSKALAFFNSEPLKNFPYTDHETDALISQAALAFIDNQTLSLPSTHSSLQLEGWIYGVPSLKK